MCTRQKTWLKKTWLLQSEAWTLDVVAPIRSLDVGRGCSNQKPDLDVARIRTLDIVAAPIRMDVLKQRFMTNFLTCTDANTVLKKSR